LQEEKTGSSEELVGSSEEGRVKKEFGGASLGGFIGDLLADHFVDKFRGGFLGGEGHCQKVILGNES
jgi:hypothetical protein